jgi:hypothetical protein
MIDAIRSLDAKASSGFLRPQHVKEALHIPTGASVLLLEAGIRFGHFQARYDVQCPKCHRKIASFDYRREIPKHVPCVATSECEDLTESETPVIEKVYVVR